MPIRRFLAGHAHGKSNSARLFASGQRGRKLEERTWSCPPPAELRVDFFSGP